MFSNIMEHFGTIIDADSVGLGDSLRKLNQITDRSYREFLAQKYPDLKLRQDIVFTDEVGIRLFQMIRFKEINITARANPDLYADTKWQDEFKGLARSLNLPHNDSMIKMCRENDIVTPISNDIKEFLI